MKLTIPEPSLVVLMGPSGSGKSTFARKHFRPSEILSSDHCRYLVSDDENNQAATNDAFEVLHCILAKRLEARKLTVIDATNVQVSARKPLLELARRCEVIPIAIVLDLPEPACFDRNRTRPDRTLEEQVIRNQREEMRDGIPGLVGEGFHYVYVFDDADQIDSVQIERQ